MYPTNATELTALIAVLVPLVIATCSGWMSVRNRAAQSRREDWSRIRDLTLVLYNKGKDHGYWSQIVAARELGDFRKYRDEIGPLLDEAHAFWTDGGEPGSSGLMSALLAARAKLNRKTRRWPIIVGCIALAAGIAVLAYYGSIKSDPSEVDKEERCLTLQGDFFQAHPRRKDSKELFKLLECEHDGHGPIYAPPTDRELRAGKPLPWGGYPPPRNG